jgi:hypothetical protein
MKGLEKKIRRGERGSVMALSAIAMLSILLAAGLGVDISRFYLGKERAPECSRRRSTCRCLSFEFISGRYH